MSSSLFDDITISEGGSSEGEIFKSLAPESKQLTFRAIFIGTCLGSLICCSNIYIGLKIGWSLYANLFAAILGFCFVNIISKSIKDKKLSVIINFLLGGDEGNIKEICILTTTAVAAGGLVAGFMSAIPALAWFGYTYSIFSLFLWVTSAAYYGAFFALPLRRYALIIKNLKFPTGTATAAAIQSMHNSKSGTNIGMNQGKILLITFACASFYTFISAYFPIFAQIPIFSYLSLDGRIGYFTTLAIWRFSIKKNISPAFIGTGMLIGTRVALSYAIGAYVAWGVLGPIVLSQGWVSSQFGFTDPVNEPSAQYWLLWIGIALMVSNSLTELFLTLFPFKYLKRIFSSQKVNETSFEKRDLINRIKKIDLITESDTTDDNDDLIKSIKSTKEKDDQSLSSSSSDKDNLNIKRVKKRNANSSNTSSSTDENYNDYYEYFTDSDEGENDEIIKTDQTGEVKENDIDGQVPRHWWIIGLSLSSIFTIVVVSLFFELLWYEIVLALFLAFFLSFICIQATGETDINPITVVGKITQLIFAYVTPGSYVGNIMAANITTSAAAQSVDLIGDLKTGLLLNVKPREQFIAQLIGSFFGVIFSIATYTLMTTAYPCIVTLEDLPNCSFQVPGASAWYGVAFAFNSEDILATFPKYSLLAILISTIIGCVSPVIVRLLPAKCERYWISINGFGLAFVGPQAYLASAFLIGSFVFLVWEKVNQRTFSLYGLCVASGLSAGEGVTGVLLSFFAMFGLLHQFCYLIPSDLPYICI